MPELPEQPITKSALPECLKPFLFTSETAAQAARKRHEADRIRKEEIDRLAQPPEPALTDERLALLDEQIKLTRLTLNSAKMEPHHRAALVRALCALLNEQRIAKGEPLPGSRRPKEDGRRGASAGWIELQPALPGAQLPATVSQVQPARPMGWEYETPSTVPQEPERLPGDVTP